MSEQAENVERGRLVLAAGWGKRLGLNGPNKWWTCVNCGCDFPEIDGKIMCNGHTITKCPFCRSDSEPWKHGRGR